MDPYALQDANSALKEGLGVYNTIRGGQQKQKEAMDNAALKERMGRSAKMKAYGNMTKEFGSDASNKAADVFNIMEKDENGVPIGLVGPQDQIMGNALRAKLYQGSK